MGEDAMDKFRDIVGTKLPLFRSAWKGKRQESDGLWLHTRNLLKKKLLDVVLEVFPQETMAIRVQFQGLGQSETQLAGE